MRLSGAHAALLTLAVLMALGSPAESATHVWEVQSTGCVVRKDCPTVVLKGTMSGPKDSSGANKWEFGNFHAKEVFPHFTRAHKDSHWKVTLVDRQSASGGPFLAPGGSRSSTPIKMCCSFFDKKNPSVRCKANDYLQNVNPKDDIALLFGPRRPADDRLSNRLPKSGPAEFEVQDRRRKCPVAAGSQYVTIHSTRSLPTDKSVGLASHFEAKKASVHKVKEDTKWFPTLGRIDGNDRDEEPERLCCTVSNKGPDDSEPEIQCLAKSWFKRIRKGTAIQVWTASARRPRRNRLYSQTRCQGLPRPTKQGWSPLAFPDPLPEDIAEAAQKKAVDAMKAAETFSKK